MINKIMDLWSNSDKDRKNVLISCALVFLIALVSLLFIPENEPEYFPFTVLVSQFLVNSLLMSWKIKRRKHTVLDRRSGKFFSAKRHWFLVAYFFLMFPGFVFTIISGLSLFAFVPLTISRAYLFINNLPLTAMNLFFLTANPVKNDEYKPSYHGYNDWRDYYNNSPSCKNLGGNTYYDSTYP